MTGKSQFANTEMERIQEEDKDSDAGANETLSSPTRVKEAKENPRWMPMLPKLIKTACSSSVKSPSSIWTGKVQ